jgi:hypothetical protein
MPTRDRIRSGKLSFSNHSAEDMKSVDISPSSSGSVEPSSARKTSPQSKLASIAVRFSHCLTNYDAEF